MGRRVFNIATAASLLICCVTMALWVRSHYTRDDFDELKYVLIPPQAGQSNSFATSYSKELNIWPGTLDLLTVEEPADLSATHEPPHPWERYQQWWDPFITHYNPYNGPNLHDTPVEAPGLFEHFGFARVYVQTGPLIVTRTVVSLRLIVAIALLLPVAWTFRRFRRSRRFRADHCDQCGYNLTGNTSGVCPECGTAIPATSKC